MGPVEGMLLAPGRDSAAAVPLTAFAEPRSTTVARDARLALANVVTSPPRQTQSRS